MLLLSKQIAFMSTNSYTVKTLLDSDIYQFERTFCETY
jgi:hypothetical protein